MNYPLVIAEVQAKFQNAKEKYSSLIQLYNLVQTWQYATWDLYSLVPHYSERHKFPRGKLLGITSDKWSVKHGLDSNGNCITTNERVEFAGQFYETFREYISGTVFEYRYSYSGEKDILAVSKYSFENGQLTTLATWGANGNSITVFEYTSGTLVREILTSPNDPKLLNSVGERSINYSHDSRGLVSIVEGKYFWYFRLTTAEFETLIERARQELKLSILEEIIKIEEPVAKIALLYEKGFAFPPTIKACSLKYSEKHSGSGFTLRPCDWDMELNFYFDRELMNKLNNISEVSMAKFKKLIELIGEVAYSLSIAVSSQSKSKFYSDNLIVSYSDFDGTFLKKNDLTVRGKISSLTSSST